MTIISCMFSCLSLLILFCGADFTTCIENEDAKPKISLVAGVGMLLAGLLVIIAVSWSANSTVTNFNNPLVDASNKMELGACIFVGWGAGVLLLLSGGLICCFSRPKSGSSGGTAKYYSNSSAPAANKNYRHLSLTHATEAGGEDLPTGDKHSPDRPGALMRLLLLL
ncbi:hypothetical protein FQN60_004151 [Etheostoma spectabile]|uniref:Uncharacterized protein n=1 Tax=Etheostoma spectabile TaxID=54343 RepID=A0A5J5CUQ8_9PERO|nr:hypothetical protein FQN60_004151 [Etheostoma spectabile]